MRYTYEIIRDAQAGIEITDAELREQTGLYGFEVERSVAEGLGLAPGWFEVQMSLVRRQRELLAADAAARKATTPPTPPQPRHPHRLAVCNRCGNEFPASQAMSSDDGTVCPDCY